MGKHTNYEIYQKSKRLLNRENTGHQSQEIEKKRNKIKKYPEQRSDKNRQNTVRNPQITLKPDIIKNIKFF